MKRLLAFLALASATALGVTLMSGGSGMAGDLIPEKTSSAFNLGGPETSIFECFGLSNGDTLNEEVLIQTDNFGVDQIVIRKLIMMCETGSMGNGSLPDPTRILACYAIDRGQDPDDDADLSTALAPDGVEVRKSTMVCAEGKKELATYGGGYDPEVGDGASFAVWQCFTLKQGYVAERKFPFETSNFGSHYTQIREARLMCESAFLHPSGYIVTDAVVTVDRDFGVMECWALTGPDIDKNVRISVPNALDAVGAPSDDIAYINRAQLVCLPAEKDLYPGYQGTVLNPGPSGR